MKKNSLIVLLITLVMVVLLSTSCASDITLPETLKLTEALGVTGTALTEFDPDTADSTKIQVTTLTGGASVKFTNYAFDVEAGVSVTELTGTFKMVSTVTGTTGSGSIEMDVKYKLNGISNKAVLKMTMTATLDENENIVGTPNLKVSSCKIDGKAIKASSVETLLLQTGVGF